MASDALRDGLSRQPAAPAEHGGAEADGTDEKALGTVESGTGRKGKAPDRVDGLCGLGDRSRAEHLGRPQKPQPQKAGLLRQESMLEGKIAQREGEQGKAVPVLARASDGRRSLGTADKGRSLRTVAGRAGCAEAGSGSRIEPQLERTPRTWFGFPFF